MSTNRHVNGALDALVREDQNRIDERRRNERLRKAESRARASGFSARQAPFAAMAYMTITALGGTPTSEAVRTRVRAQFPWLWEETA
jgi:hypothetical protein